MNRFELYRISLDFFLKYLYLIVVIITNFYFLYNMLTILKLQSEL